MEKVICEIASPLKTWNNRRVDEWIDQIAHVINTQQIKLINLSEVIEEERLEKRNIPYIPKMDNVQFARLLKKKMPNTSPILCKISTRVSKSNFLKWVDKAYLDGIRYLVVVGSLHSDPTGNSFTVNEAANQIKQLHPDIIVGGIVIFNRENEVKRILDKVHNGIDFFISQIIFETSTMKSVLQELQLSCQKTDSLMPQMYISLAPAAGIKDIAFMRWLGVDIPSAVLTRITGGGDEAIQFRTFAVVQQIINEVIEFTHVSDIPLGFNIEHILYGNLSLAEELIHEAKNRMTCV